MKLASLLFDPPVEVRERDPRGVTGGLFPAEEAMISRAIDKRRHQFTAGRLCARAAFVALGAPPGPILHGEDRAPIWPPGVVGTITHTDTWCAAAAARESDGVRSLGLDVEPDTPLKPELIKTITVPEERVFLDAQPASERYLLAKLIFSAKECAYKCQYPLSRAYFGFQGMRVHLDMAGGAFVAVFQREAGEFAPGDELRGRLLIAHGHVLTAMTL
jgi:4'-phosphopantetheinyl transferase EntD